MTKNHLCEQFIWGLLLSFWFGQGPPVITEEEGFMTFTVAYHQGLSGSPSFLYSLWCQSLMPKHTSFIYICRYGVWQNVTFGDAISSHLSWWEAPLSIQKRERDRLLSLLWVVCTTALYLVKLYFFVIVDWWHYWCTKHEKLNMMRIQQLFLRL